MQEQSRCRSGPWGVPTACRSGARSLLLPSSTKRFPPKASAPEADGKPNHICAHSASSACSQRSSQRPHGTSQFIEVAVEQVCNPYGSLMTHTHEAQNILLQGSAEASQFKSSGSTKLPEHAAQGVHPQAGVIAEASQSLSGVMMPQASGKSTGLGEQFRLLRPGFLDTEAQSMQGELQATQLEVRALQVQNKALRRIQSDGGPPAANHVEKTQLVEELKNQKELVSNLVRDLSSVCNELAKRPVLAGYCASQSDDYTHSFNASQHSQLDDAIGLGTGCTRLGEGSSQPSSTGIGNFLQESEMRPDQQAPGMHHREAEDHQLLAVGEMMEASADFPQRCIISVKDRQLSERAQRVAREALRELLAQHEPDVLERWLEPKARSADIEPERTPQGSWPSPCDAFSRFRLGTNLTLSQDACTLTREKGCRQAVAIGNGPLRTDELGWYFEVEILEVISGWMGGLGIGVTVLDSDYVTSLPDRLPDKAWRLPNTYMAGYWGRIFCAGKEHRTMWNAESLEVHDRVGFLVTTEGEILVFVNGTQKAWLNAGIPVPTQTERRHLLPVVDVFSATKSIHLIHGAEPPTPPWSAPPTPVDALSPASAKSTIGSPICTKQ
eukprot:gnl/MRDRNA2_/MRDRNA2_30925_c0_seq1.p1 gnl/MRDRNA2_/MRDRNA2_30925_c0~~gnl/MRDRNA2_/MRDRNA2_30925_c0_seq1.p1  ORF type:complete len:611 (-),score=111.59 gnl/MRDRNA2_/MRDRNA2_30925_c0_seq1:20-1852(-)